LCCATGTLHDGTTSFVEDRIARRLDWRAGKNTGLRIKPDMLRERARNLLQHYSELGGTAY